MVHEDQLSWPRPLRKREVWVILYHLLLHGANHSGSNGIRWGEIPAACGFPGWNYYFQNLVPVSVAVESDGSSWTSCFYVLCMSCVLWTCTSCQYVELEDTDSFWLVGQSHCLGFMVKDKRLVWVNSDSVSLSVSFSAWHRRRSSSVWRTSIRTLWSRLLGRAPVLGLKTRQRANTPNGRSGPASWTLSCRWPEALLV